MSRTSSGGVLVACPKTQHSYQAALALQEHGALLRYVTGFYYKRPSALSVVASNLPGSVGRRVERELRRRRLNELDDQLIETVPLTDLLCALVERNPRLRPWSDRLGLWNLHLRRFEDRVIDLIQRLRPAVVLCYDTCALRIFAAARQVGAVCVLDQTIGHVTQLLREFEAAGIPINLPASFVRESVEEVRAADVIVTASDYVVESLTRVGADPDRMLTIPYGVDLARFHPTESARPRDAVRALYVGQVSARNGIPYLVSAFELMENANLELHVIGRLLGDSNWVRARGARFLYQPAVPQQEVNEAYQAADFFVQPTLHEGSSLTIFEALASGLPVITTPNAGSIVRDGVEGFIVPPRDVAALANRMQQLAQDHALREQMSRRARQRAELFSWQSYRERLAAALASLAAAPSQQRRDVVAAHRRDLRALLDTGDFPGTVANRVDDTPSGASGFQSSLIRAGSYEVGT